MGDKYYVTDTDLSERFPIYTRANVGEVFPDPVTPLTRAIGEELGSRLRLWERLDVAAALWRLDLASETVWNGDDGTTAVSGATRRYAAYNAQTAMSWGPIDITPRDLTTTIISVVVLIGVALVLQRSRLGKATRAVSDNVDLASSTGIDSEKIIRIVWFLGSALAALGGIVRGLDEGVRADMGGGLLFLMFAGITLGGLGSAYGALVGGFVIGVFVEASTIGIPIFPDLPLLGWIKHGVPTELKNVPSLAALILILLFRPKGILGKKERVG